MWQQTGMIITILADIFKRSLKTGDVAADGHDANIFSVYKKDKLNGLANYRPISLISIASMLMKHIIHNSIRTSGLLWLADKLAAQTFLRDSISFSHPGPGLFSWFKLSIDAITIDFGKAFDTVPHKRHLYKLSCYGIRGETLTSIKYFLSTVYTRV